MSKEKQIEEMAKIIHGYCEAPCPNDGCDNCFEYSQANRLYNAGYRKQSEGKWIERHAYDRNWDSFYNLTCPECGALFRDITKSEISSRYKFCSVCGVKLKGGE